MTYHRLILTLIGCLATVTGFAQANLLNAKTPEEIGLKTLEQIKYDNDEPLEYGYVDDRDVLWSKTVWEIVDLDERVNFPLYYPIDTAYIGKSRRSLYDTLLKGINNGDIETIYSDSYFNQKRTLGDIEAALVLKDTTDLGVEQYNAEGRVDDQYIITREISSADVSEYHIKGIWFFDKRQGELKYRLLGLAPCAPDVNFIDDENNNEVVELFWVWFPGARYVLHDSKVFNNRNTSQAISFDHLLNSRRFNGVIYKEDNVYGDRTIEDYINDNALMQLLESDRIKEQIRNFEQDMWNY